MLLVCRKIRFFAIFKCDFFVPQRSFVIELKTRKNLNITFIQMSISKSIRVLVGITKQNIFCSPILLTMIITIIVIRYDYCSTCYYGMLFCSAAIVEHSNQIRIGNCIALAEND